MYSAILIRHGESQANAGFPTTEPKDVELTKKGREQAQSVARILKKNFSLSLIVVSSFLRTKQTADSTRTLFPSVSVEEWNVEEFTYLSSMHQELSTTEERRPLVQTYWDLLDPHYQEYVDSESFATFIGRVRTFINRLHETACSLHCDGAIAVFSHEQFMTAVRWLIDVEQAGKLIEISSQRMREFRSYFEQHRISNGGIVGIKIRCNQYPSLSRELFLERPESLDTPILGSVCP